MFRLWMLIIIIVNGIPLIIRISHIPIANLNLLNLVGSSNSSAARMISLSPMLYSFSGTSQSFVTSIIYLPATPTTSTLFRLVFICLWLDIAFGSKNMTIKITSCSTCRIRLDYLIAIWNYKFFNFFRVSFLI